MYPTVDSDLDRSRNAGLASNTGTHGTTGAYGTTGTSTGAYGTAGPHTSNLANKADPRGGFYHLASAMTKADMPAVDSDLDGSRNVGLASNTGAHGTSTTGTHGTTGAYGTTGTSTTSTHGTSGPHTSNVANKVDPRGTIMLHRSVCIWKC